MTQAVLDAPTGATRRQVWRRIARWSSWAVLAIAVSWLWPSSFGGATTVLVVQGDSMRPTLNDGDVVLARPRAHYDTGDVVVFTIDLGEPGGPTAQVMHRIIAIGADGSIVTQGDNRSEADGFRTTADDVVGEVRGHVPHGGHVLWLLSRWWTLALVGGTLTALHMARPRADHRLA